MNTISVRVRYRPVRFGWCVRTGNLEDVRHVLRLTHTLCGGRHNPIIPIGSEDSLARQLVEVFHVDVLYSPAPGDQSIKDFIATFAHLIWPSFYKEFFVDGMNGKIATFLDVYHPTRKIFEEHVKDKSGLNPNVRFCDWDDADPLSNVLHATIGAYPPPIEIGKDYGEFFRKNLRATTVQLTPRDAFPSDLFAAFTPNALASYELERDRSPNWDTPGIYVGNAADFDDIVNFWNLRAADIDVLFFDPTQAMRIRPMIDAYIAVLEQKPPHPVEWLDRIGIWSKAGTAVDAAIFGMKRGASRIEVSDGIWNGLNIKPPVMFIEDHSALASVSELTGVPALSFELRPKAIYQEPEFHTQDLVVSLRPLVDAPVEAEATFRYPLIPELNEYYGREAHFIYNEARVEPDGLALITSVTSTDLSIRAVRNKELVSKIFEVFGIKAEPSKPGRIASRLIQQMGGVQGCRVFKIAGVRELVEQFGPLDTFTRSHAIRLIGCNDPVTGQPNFERYQPLFVEGRKITAHGAFDFLLKHEVFQVGINFVCPHCELDFWKPLDDVTVELKCDYCGRLVNIAPQLRDRDWAYRRSGLFGREDHQEGSIPVALLLQQLDTALHRDVVLVTGMNLEAIRGQIENCETDFVAVTEGYERRVSMAIGECKSSGGEISTDDVRKMTLVADVLKSSNRIEPYIVFAKTAAFTPEEVNRCRTAQSGSKRRVILLSARELEPYFMYRLAEKEFDIRSSAVSFEHMANVTHDIYFEPKLKTKEPAPQEQ
jgi:hypothetical protein